MQWHCMCPLSYMQCPHNMNSWAQTVHNSGLWTPHGVMEITVHRTWTLCPVCSTGLSLWQSVLSVANVFLVLPSISCHVLSIPEYKLLFTAPLSCMAVCSPYLHNAVTFYICTFSAGNSCLILPFHPHWMNWDIPSTCYSLHVCPHCTQGCVHTCSPVSVCLDISLILHRGSFCPVLCRLGSQLQLISMWFSSRAEYTHVSILY